ncbi:MAG: hypothetical protein KJ063_23385 [Anaerolineae bacterium]|nr:hypothetical protein [Anaerolineae bacterium]
MSEKQSWQADQSRRIIQRILIEGELVLQTPTSLGGGDSTDLTDMPLLVSLSDEQTPLLTGASLAGALRSYVRTREMGYLAPEPDHFKDDRVAYRRTQKQEWNSLAQTLFGGEYAESVTAGEQQILMDQSAILIDDALGEAHTIETRFGVMLTPQTRTAADDKLFDTQLWPAGTTFPLRLELLIRESDNADQLKQGLAAALDGLAKGEIMLGGRKRRGYGQVQVKQWQVRTFDLQKVSDLLAWLEEGAKPLNEQKSVITEANIYQALEVKAWEQDKRHSFTMKSTFALDGSLLIRTANSQGDQVADFVHLQAKQVDGKLAPVLSGTSLAGALRGRAHKIANTIANEQRAKTLIYDLFGPDMDDSEWAKTQANQKDGRVQPRASRLLVAETVIEHGITDRVQNRVSIDRFTGGARDTALFNEQPVWGKPETCITVDLRLLNPKPCEVGLLLLLLKDLWTGDLALGGESSVGRGRLKGKEATLTLGETTWEIKDADGRLQFGGSGPQSELQQFVDALHQEVS